MQVTADKFITQKESTRLFKTMLAHQGTKASLVEYHLYKLLSLTGLRISEALTLRWEDILEDHLIIRAENSKNGKRGTVVLGKQAQALISAFKGLNPYPSLPYLFNTQKGPMSRIHAHTRLKYWLSVSGLRNTITCHSFRHSYATQALDAGISLALVKEQLRHSNISVTSSYLHHTQASLEKLRECF